MALPGLKFFSRGCNLLRHLLPSCFCQTALQDLDQGFFLLGGKPIGCFYYVCKSALLGHLITALMHVVPFFLGRLRRPKKSFLDSYTPLRPLKETAA